MFRNEEQGFFWEDRENKQAKHSSGKKEKIEIQELWHGILQHIQKLIL